LRPDIHAELSRLLGNQDFNNFNHTLADVESLSICYMTEKERYEQLKMMLDDDYYRLKSSNAKYDPCLETEILLRRAERGVDRKRMMHKYLRSKSVGVKSVGSQTQDFSDYIYFNQSFPRDKRLSSAKSVDRLDHSILELTSVINNSTVVSGRTIKNNPKEKFSVKINLPSGSSDNEDNDSSIYSNSNLSYTQPAKLNTDYYYYPKLASAIITPNTSINLPHQHQNTSLNNRSVSVSSINSPRDYSQDNKYQLNNSASSSQSKPYVLECNEVEKFDLYESIKEGPVNLKINQAPKPSQLNTNNLIVNRIPSNSSNVSSPSTLSPSKYQTLQHLVLPSSNLPTNNVQKSNVNVDFTSPTNQNKFGYDFKKNLLKNQKDVIEIDFDSYERQEQKNKSLSPQPRPMNQQTRSQLTNKTINYDQFIGRPQQKQQQPPPTAPRPASRNLISPNYGSPQTREQQKNVFRFDDEALAEKENRNTTPKYTNLNSRLYFQPNKGDKIDIDLSIYDEQSNTISKNNNNYSNSTSTSSLYNKKVRFINN
jgi:hypothetical protein